MLRYADNTDIAGDAWVDEDPMGEDGEMECGASFGWGTWCGPYYDYEDGEDA